MEVMEYVKHPGKFACLGGKLLKGMILTGGLGTGKTLLAKTIAEGMPMEFSKPTRYNMIYLGATKAAVFDACRMVWTKLSY
ncbi:hypothetical protein MKW92_004631 [Papaver armeniacum]|nr:hypothetical protein MKW92_004631 [Papaver armeniacum]